MSSISISQHKTSLLKKVGVCLRLAEQYGFSDIADALSGLQVELMKVNSATDNITESLMNLKPINEGYTVQADKLADKLVDVCRFYALNAKNFFKCENTLDDIIAGKCETAFKKLRAVEAEIANNGIDVNTIGACYDATPDDIEAFSKAVYDEMLKSECSKKFSTITYKCIEDIESIDKNVLSDGIVWYKEGDLSEVKVDPSGVKITFPEYEHKTIAIAQDSFINNLTMDIDNRMRITAVDQVKDMVVNTTVELCAGSIRYLKDQYVSKIKEIVDIFKEDYLNVLNDSFSAISDKNIVEMADNLLKLEETMINADIYKGQYHYYPVVDKGEISYIPSAYYPEIKKNEIHQDKFAEIFDEKVLHYALEDCVKVYEKALTNSLKAYDGSAGITLPSVNSYAGAETIPNALRKVVSFYDKIEWGNLSDVVNNAVKDAKALLIDMYKDCETRMVSQTEDEVLKQIGWLFSGDCSRELAPFVAAWTKQVEQEFASIRSQCAYYNRMESEDFYYYYEKVYSLYYGRNTYIEWLGMFKNKGVIDSKVFEKYKFTRINGNDGKVWVHEVLYKQFEEQLGVFGAKIKDISARWDKDFTEYEQFAFSQCGHYFDEIDAIMKKDIIGKWGPYQRKVSDRSNYKAGDILEFAMLNNVFNFVQKEFLEGVVREAVGFYKFQNSKGVLLESRVKSYIRTEIKKKVSDWEAESHML